MPAGACVTSSELTQYLMASFHLTEKRQVDRD
jgi:hypothetical protein